MTHARDDASGRHADHAAAELRIDITNAGTALTQARRDRVRRRVLIAMSRFERHVRDVRARISRSRNPLGGLDVRCRVRARLQSGAMLQAEAIDGQIESAVGRAAARLALLVAAVLDGGPARPRFVPVVRS